MEQGRERVHNRMTYDAEAFHFLSLITEMKKEMEPEEIIFSRGVRNHDEISDQDNPF